jgi:hypothetical protein
VLLERADLRDGMQGERRFHARQYTRGHDVAP